MTITKLAKLIGLQPEMLEIVKRKEIAVAPVLDLLPKFQHKATWESGLDELKKCLLPDGDGTKMLTAQLLFATASYEKYKSMGISDDIFVATMKCFVRFIDQCKTVYGKWMFDREWWVVRQLSLMLFRIGELEFELNEIEGEKCINIHIPSDASILPHLVKESIEKAKIFIAKYFPSYKNRNIVCDSWLLSPCLKFLLPESSNIIKFLNMFDLMETNNESTDFMLYVFNTNTTNFHALPEKTTLQRNMKAHLISGGKVGSTFGILK